MSNLRLKEVANDATNKDFYNSFFTSSKVTFLIGLFGQLISSLTEFHFIYAVSGGAYNPLFTISNVFPCALGVIGIYIFEVVGVRIYLVRIIRQIVNLDFKGSERKMLFAFNMIFVLALCGSNLLLSYLGQKYSFASITNVTTTDVTHDLSNEKALKIQSINYHFDTLKTALIRTNERSKTSITESSDYDVKELKNSRYTVRENKIKYDNYTKLIDSKLASKTSDLSDLTTQLNTDKERLRSDRTTQINSITANFDNRINDVSKTENSNLDLWLMVQRYTLPILVIFILLSWVAIIYNEIFLKGSGQTIEIKKIEKRPLLILELIGGLYEKIYQMFYWVVARIIGDKKYKFGEIKQEVIKYQIKQNNPISIAAKIRPIGFNRNNENNQNTTNLPTNSNDTNTDDLSNYRTTDTDTDGERLSVNVPIENNATNESKKACKNCNEIFTYKHWNAKYCSDKCRIENWEKRTGKTLKKKSKK